MDADWLGLPASNPLVSYPFMYTPLARFPCHQRYTVRWYLWNMPARIPRLLTAKGVMVLLALDSVVVNVRRDTLHSVRHRALHAFALHW
jgi:hypothetical protein